MYTVETLKTLPLMDARQHLGELVELVRYTNQQFRVTRNKRPMARLVSEPFMQALEQLMAGDPALAETLDIMMNQDMMDAIEQGTREVAEGKLLPLEAVFEK